MASVTDLDHKLDKHAIDHVENINETRPPLEDLDSIEQTDAGKFAWLVSITAAIGGMLFGYDTGIISAVLVYIGTSLDHKTLKSNEKELITSITSGAAFFGAIFAGLTADKYGRKPGIYLGCVLFIIGAVIQAAAFSLAQMTVGRLVVGFGVGSAAMIVPMYIAEVSPAKYRGRMIGLDNMSITGGQLISYGIGAAFASVKGGWRYMVGGGAIPAIILLCLLPFCPESPRQLIYHGKVEEAKSVIRRIYPNGTDLQVEQKAAHIEAHIEYSKQLTAGWSQWRIFRELYTPANFRALVAACGLMAISQLGGFNSLMYYSSTLFALVGFADPVAVGTVIAATNFIFTWVNMMLVDRIGRRRILLCTMPFMGLFLIFAAITFHWIPVNHDLTLKEGAKVGAPAIIVLICMICYVGFYSSGIGNTAWLSSEFFPMEVRAMGAMQLTCTSWGSNVIVASTFLTQMENTTPSGAFGFYAAVTLLGCFPCVYFCYPEVKGMTLEDIRALFQHGFGVKESLRVQKEQKALAKSGAGSTSSETKV
ncbi:general substrate transporter [Myriangium duriaei CBS 260.36]|uniref:General substrate transporter n=1 Tax=Myriangium duriaei CBS 260.36 TaxID=1168546 RepID=A0A9P4J296_9PEZI|nr:general substrate transporter [Myriangium duriaei CBS 260.36]